MNKTIGVTAVSLGIAMLCSQSAQALPKLNIPGATPAAAGGSTMDIKQMKADLETKTATSLKECARARLEFVASQELLMEALGLKAEFATKLAEAKTLSEGNSSVADQKKAQVITQEANEKIAKTLAEAKELSPESKQKYKEGVVKFASGVSAETSQIAVITELASTAQSIAQNAPVLEKAGAIAAGKPALDLAAMIPGDVKQAMGTLGTLVSFAKKQQIEVPKDATKLLD
jgi:hypothetical protein